MPGVEQPDFADLEVGRVASDDREVVHERSCGDQAVDGLALGGCVQPSPLLAHTIVYRQDAIGEVISQLLEPGSEDVGLIGVASAQTLDPLADLPDVRALR